MSTLLIVFDSITFTASVLAAVLNTRLVIRHYRSNHADRRHYSTLFLSLILYLCFNVSSIVYAVDCLSALLFDRWSPTFVFWTGSTSFAFAFAFIVSNCCITVDRIVAMRQPVFYVIKYSRYCQVVSVVLMATAFSTIFAWQSSGLLLPRRPVPAFHLLTRVDVLRSLGLAKNSLSLLNMVITVVFLLETRRFLKTQKNQHVYRSANQIVFSQVAAEIVLMVIPGLSVTVASFFGIGLLGIAGPFVIPLSAVYTLVCGLLLTFKVRKADSPISTSIVTPKSVGSVM
uniref:G protein-coupled receptor n=1 Tax=Steinernema glaseri TaxID=37863 RepID=A0A1I7Y5X5_9BILA